MSGNKKIIRYLLYLALVTTLIASATLAKYSTMLEAGAQACVAAFTTNNTVDFNMALDDMLPGSTKEVSFTVVNFDGVKDCQVGLDYDIQVSTTGNLPLAFRLEGTKESGDSDAKSQVTGGLSQVEDRLWKAENGKFPVASGGGRKRHSYTLYVDWPSSAEAADYSEEIDMLTVTVTTRQSQAEIT